jgi:hypothetical protein
MVEKSLGERADWKAVDAAMVQAAALAEKVAAFRHPKLAAVRLAGELNKKPTEGTLDELLERLKASLAEFRHAKRTPHCGGPSRVIGIQSGPHG